MLCDLLGIIESLALCLETKTPYAEASWNRRVSFDFGVRHLDLNSGSAVD